MFFRNQKAKIESFEERISGLKELGFTAASRCSCGLRRARKFPRWRPI
jgi:hypothetical protein